MTKAIILMVLILPFMIKAQTGQYASYPVYTGNDLGMNYPPGQSSFRIWAPTATHASLLLYNEGIGGAAMQTIDMQKRQSGTWTAIVKQNLKGKFYVFRVQVNNEWLNEVPDPYAKTVGVNGKRAMVADLKETDPLGWSADKSPVLNNPTDAIIYELHISDTSIAINSGISNKGKFLGLTEKGTKNQEGLSTGLDHLKELGVTHIHLLPFFDFYSIDESKPEKLQYNWGYDPLNYNAPEGSYSTNAGDGTTRIRELKELVKTFHQNGLNVV